MEGVFPTLCGLVCERDYGVFLYQFKCLSTRVPAIPDESAVGMVRVLGFQFRTVLRKRRQQTAEQCNKKQ